MNKFISENDKDDDVRIKFTTTLKKSCLKKLSCLKYELRVNSKNDVIEKIVDDYYKKNTRR